MRRRETYIDYYDRIYPLYGKYRNRVKNITIVITEACQMRCTYCYECRKNDSSMTKETVKKIVDFLFEEDAKRSPLLNPENAECLILDFIGGEPLLKIDLIDYFVVYFRQKAASLNHRWATQYVINITSNGLLYDSPKVQDFIRRNFGKVSFTISIDGNKELHDSCRKLINGDPTYDLVLKNAKKLLEQQPWASTKMTLSPENIMHTYEGIRSLYEDVGYHAIYANCVFEEGWTQEHAREFYAQLIKLGDWIIDNGLEDTLFCSLFDESIGQPLSPCNNQNWCGGNGAMLSFTPDGSIQPCLRYARLSLGNSQPELRIGDLENGLLGKPEYEENLGCLQSITRRSQSTDECFNCPIASGCAWCSGYNYQVFGTPNKRATFICPMHKARVLANHHYWNRLYKKRGIDRIFELHMPEEWIKELTD